MVKVQQWIQGLPNNFSGLYFSRQQTEVLDKVTVLMNTVKLSLGVCFWLVFLFYKNKAGHCV